MGQVLLTGASGFIGRNLMEHLRQDGFQPIAWVRNQTSALDFEQLGYQVQVGDLAEASRFIRKSPSIRAVIHLASVVAPISRAQTFEVNVAMTQRLALSCSELPNPPTFVYVSSLSASGPCVDGLWRRESDLCMPRSIYGESKAAAEESLKLLASKIPISIVRPPAVIGPWDRNLLQMFQTVKKGWNLIGISSKYQYSFIHVADLTRGIVDVMNRGKRLMDRADSGIYFLSDANPITFVELGNQVAKALQAPSPRHITVPRTVCKAVALVSEAAARGLNMRTYLNLDKIREAEAGSWVCDTTRAREELGFVIDTPLQQRVLETADWYRSQIWI